jgi:tetratricopeptide (TPR) repeat protein/predicted aspartyl protease
VHRYWVIQLAVLSFSASPAHAFAACKLAKMAELPVTMSNLKPVITAQINGEEARFVADSGAFYSLITQAGAAQYKLKVSAAPFGLFIKGIGGNIEPSVATVKIFTIAGVPLHNIEFLVGGSTVGRSESVGVLGQNFFRIGDVEYDLARGAIRLMRAKDCGRTVLAYWVKPSEPYSVMDIEPATLQSPHTTGTAFATSQSLHTTGTAFINGARIRVIFDSGAGMSILSSRAAERAGVRPDTPGVTGAGYVFGLGRGSIKTYTGPFSSFKIGDEEIRNTQLRFGDIGVEDADMLIGADFFLSHRIYVASSQRKLFFTYNGGPVFNLTAAADAQAMEGEIGDEPADAAAYSRRGMAFAARRDYQHALADLTRACELDPTVPDYFYQRGVVYREDQQFDRAAADLDRALELKPDHLSALQVRALLRLRVKDIAGATADLASADRAAPKEADIRLFLARSYQSADLMAASVAQYDLWIAAHRADSRMPEALSNRCWMRALLGQDLDTALNDCNIALKLSGKSAPFTARILNSRGLVRLRRGEYDKSLADYDDSMKLNPKDAWVLYGRGIDKVRQGKSAEGEADMAAATALWPPIEDEFKSHGIAP